MAASGGEEQAVKAAKRAAATSRPTARRASATTCSRRWEAGIALQGSEVKSLRDGKANLKDSYALVRDGEVWLHNVHIAPYAPGRAARATSPSARASCCCTSGRSSA